MTIGFKKTFDTIRWDAIDIIIELLEFDGIFREMIMTCLHSASFSMLEEGSPTELFIAQRVMIGDPLSPLLFILVMDYLTRLIEKAVEEA